MSKPKITLFFTPSRITLLYSLYPIYHSKYKNHFKFTSDLNYILEKDRNDTILIVGGQDFWFNNSKKIEIFKKLREKYRKIAFFEDNASPESQLFEIIPFIDILYKRSIYTDKTNYQIEFEGNRLFTDYYSKRYAIESSAPNAPYPKLEDVNELKKIKLAWNIGFGYYPLSKTRNKMAKLLYRYFGGITLGLIPKTDYFKKGIPNPQIEKCQARFAYKGYRPSIGYQRKIFLEEINNNPIFLKGKIPLKAYNQEVKNVQALISPFGWGEVCFRDFEAVLNGALLVKPNMDHLNTYPNIFQENKTYLPINWDGSDLVETVETIFSNKSLLNEIRQNAWNEFAKSYNEIDNKIEELISDLSN
jgi:hypothetical protein